MMPTGLLSQIALIILSVGIIFTFIQPTFESIKKTQDTISVYQGEYEKVSAVNSKLDRVSGSINSLNTDDQLRLATYMPDSVDTVAVPRDVKSIADSVGVVLRQIKYVGPEKQVTASEYIDPSVAVTMPTPESMPEAHTFTFEFEGSYDQIKSVLTSLEQNSYPLEVHDLRIEKAEGGFLTVEMKIVTYDRIVSATGITS